MRRGLFILPLLLACAGTTATAPEQQRQLGTIAGFQLNDPTITVIPDGRTVAVSVTTYGGGCESQGETEVAVNGLSAVITPYDYTSTSTGACTDILRSFVHSTSIQFGTAGSARIVVRGLDGGSRTAKNLRGDTIEVVRTIGIP